MQLLTISVYEQVGCAGIFVGLLKCLNTTLAKELNRKLTFSIIIICASWNLG